MIDITKLTEKYIGRSVIYISFNNKEYGHITSFNTKYIFVDYGKNCGRGTATSPEDLSFTYDVK